MHYLLKSSQSDFLMSVRVIADPWRTILKLATISNHPGEFLLPLKPDWSGFTPNMQPVELRETLTRHRIVAVGPPSGACNFSHQNFDDWWWTFDAVTVTLTPSVASVWAGRRNYTLATYREILNKSDPGGTDSISFPRGPRHLTELHYLPRVGVKACWPWRNRCDHDPSIYIICTLD